MDVARSEGAFPVTPGGSRAEAPRGMVATAFPEATEAGVEMLRRGGNAVDAACAAALALAVCEPQGSGIGGQTMALLHVDGRTVAIDGSSHAPALAHPSRLKSQRSRELGYKATTIPTTPAVLSYLNEHYGRLPWRALLEPAIHVAGSGYRITRLQHLRQETELAGFLRVPSRSGARYFLKNGTSPYTPGDLFVQEDLARTLERLAAQGSSSLYTGSIAEQIDADMRRHGGLLRADDLALPPEVVERPPLHGSYRGLEIRSFPPPGSGHTLLLILAMLEHFPPAFVAGDTPEAYRTLAEIQRVALVDNRQRPHNPNTYPQSVAREETRAERAAELVAALRETGPSLEVRPERGSSGETTHLSVMDAEGNAIGLTQSVNLVYGARAAADGLGFLYNSYIEAFQYGRPGHYYNLRPGGIPWASVAPTLVLHDGQPWLIAGSPGSHRIFASLAQFLRWVIDGETSIETAMVRPRLFCSEEGELSVEGDRFDPSVTRHLEERGYRITRYEPYAFYMGAVQAVLRRGSAPGFQGVADVRRDGTAAGL